MKESTLRRKLKSTLGVTKPQFDKLLALGMPSDDGEFDEEQVVAWLNQATAATSDVPDVLCTTVEQLAKQMGVTSPAVHSWMRIQRDEPFPDGPPYSLVEVTHWRARNVNAGRRGRPRIEGVPLDPQDRVAALRAEKIEFELRVKRGEYVPVREITARILRATARHREILRTLPERVSAEMSRKGLKRPVINSAREAVEQAVDDVCRQIAQDLAEDADEATEDLASGDE